MEKAYYLHMRRLFPKMRLLFTDTDSVMGADLQDSDANLNFDVAGSSKDPERDLSVVSPQARSKAIELMGLLGKLGDETDRRVRRPAVQDVQHPHRPARRLAQGEAQDQGRAQEGGGRRPAS